MSNINQEKQNELSPNYTPLQVTLAKRGRTIGDLRVNAKISSATLAKIGKREMIAMHIIAKICSYLDCDVSEVFSFRSEDLK